MGYFTMQMKKIYRQRVKISTVFFAVYISFILISTLHFHRYDLNKVSNFENRQTENSALVLDFLSDGIGICAVNHFSHSILNFNFSSNELNFSLPKFENPSFNVNSFLYHLTLLDNLSPRASPLLA
jgi:hypothetical protein